MFYHRTTCPENVSHRNRVEEKAKQISELKTMYSTIKFYTVFENVISLKGIHAIQP